MRPSRLRDCAEYNHSVSLVYPGNVLSVKFPGYVGGHHVPSKYYHSE